MDKRTTHRIVRDLVLAGEHNAAFLVTNLHCEDDRNFIDSIVLWYLDNREDLLPVPPVSAYNFAGQYVHLASQRVARRFVQGLVELGMTDRAANAAWNFLHRGLTNSEVETLVRHYVADMGTSSTSEEVRLFGLAKQAGGAELEAWAQEQISDFRRRQHEMPDA
jgi:hypothetical protein